MSSPPIRPTAERDGAGHHFIVVIPVADRPRHLQACLDSLCELLRRHPYPHPITVLIADDSADMASVAAHRAIAERCRSSNLSIRHFGPDEQLIYIESLGGALHRVLGSATREHFGHKGQGVMRNLAYLKVVELLRDMPADRTLIWSLDSDQEFCVKIATPSGDREVYAIDYFHDLDAVFSRTDALMLTGKVVGDPPVSSAAMMGNFLADVLGFLERMAGSEPQCACQHHGGTGSRPGEAAYHDMADLFGFQQASEAYRYPCPLAGAHTEADCFAHFAGRLNSFFYGEHPTRVSYYEPAELFGTIQPARTVYAGNYVFRPAALDYFIPFAALRLRMSGPTLGRIVRSELGPHFVSANLPMLHKRTVEMGGQSEFRPGIETRRRAIDLSGEFERQFYGDVMLFTVERLADTHRLSAGDHAGTLDTVRTEMLEKYTVRQRGVLDQLRALETLLDDAARWWRQLPECAAAVSDFTHFVDNVRQNFGLQSSGHERINSPDGWRQWRTDLLGALGAYSGDRTAWERALCTA
jgi:hypothetical protein